MSYGEDRRSRRRRLIERSVPAHDRWSEQVTRVGDVTPILVGRAYVVFDGWMSPVGSIQCHADAATRRSKRRPRCSHCSKVEFTTATLPKPTGFLRASAAIAVPGSTAVTEKPSAAGERAAGPVPQPTSSTRECGLKPVMVTNSANSSPGYVGRTRS